MVSLEIVGSVVRLSLDSTIPFVPSKGGKSVHLVSTTPQQVQLPAIAGIPGPVCKTQTTAYVVMRDSSGRVRADAKRWLCALCEQCGIDSAVVLEMLDNEYEATR